MSKQEETIQHIMLSPSSSKRWLKCTKSGDLEASFPDATLVSNAPSLAAEEGTAAHAMAETILKHPDMLPYVTQYTSEVLRFKEEMTNARVAIEQRVDLTSIIPEPKAFGSSDAVLYSKEDKHIHIIDLKYGKHGVQAENNTQLLIYALGCMDMIEKASKSEGSIKTLSMSIVQPRVRKKTLTWTIDREQANTLKEEIKEKAQIAFNNVNAEFSPDNDICFFCPANQICPAKKELDMQDAYDLLDI